MRRLRGPTPVGMWDSLVHSHTSNHEPCVNEWHVVPGLLLPQLTSFASAPVAGGHGSAQGKVDRKKVQIAKAELSMRVKEDLKTVALGTSKINYMDPRITIAWCKRNEVRISKRGPGRHVQHR